jgi:glycerol-3-phosphate dehydrogenase (NAD(P)+)
VVAREDVAVDLQNTRENHRFFPGYKLPDRWDRPISPGLSPDAELLVVATPIAGLRPTPSILRTELPLPVLWVCKGFEAGTGKLPHQVVTEVLGSQPFAAPVRPQLCRGSGRRAADRCHAGGQRSGFCS